MFDIGKKDLAEWKFDIHVIPGSTTPIDTAGLMARAYELQEHGVQVPPEYLIRLARLPGLESAMTEAVSEGGGQPMPPEQPPVEPQAPPQPSPEEMMAMQEQAMAQAQMEQPPTPEEMAMQQMGPVA